MKTVGMGCLIGLFAVSCALAAPAKQGPQGPHRAPDFTLQGTHQETETLSSYQGQKPVLLFFWTTWCPFCQKEISSLKSTYGSLMKDGVELLAINVGEEPDKVESFVKTLYLPFRVLMDKDSEVSNSYELVGVPTYVLVGVDGTILFQDNFFPQSYKDLIEKAPAQR